ncbi:hypothetical protein XI06_25430 [Bradyrhizobium sp. CCBAU 11434]|uniref:hypothetical protein n=1 Tax=Bradyrhizobium sp. CCBAU 11434 TaxID=1630885 RepID=UPI00230606D2|nr:hypothetical protein [Bradyrhizobium sp. CCBAU 11434]MDA9523523.1 hypothetical protein [Bradyrhizobium sp. CCBAU 11434]
MLRWMVPAALAAMLTASAALAADFPAHPKRRAAAPPPPTVYVETDSDALISPADGVGSYIRNLPGTPLLPGSHTLPGYYGRPWDYDYQGSYYGGKQVDYFWRLPYSCGIYGYC